MSKKYGLKTRAVFYSLLTVFAGVFLVGMIWLFSQWKYSSYLAVICLFSLCLLSVYKIWYGILKQKEDERKY